MLDGFWDMDLQLQQWQLLSVFFLLGSPFYRYKQPSGSPFKSIVHIFVGAIQNQGAAISDGSCKTDADRYSNREGNIKLISSNGENEITKVPTFLNENEFTSPICRMVHNQDCCSEYFKADLAENGFTLEVGHAKEAKILLNVMPIWLFTLAYGIVFAQTSTFFVKQGSMMEREVASKFKIPPASFQTFTAGAILVTIPVYDCIFVPQARRFTGNRKGITLLQRIGIGLFLSILCMMVAASVEMRRLKLANDLGLSDKPDAIVPLSIFWLLPQYVLLGIADVFTVIGQQEFFYDQVPDNMRSIGGALFMLGNGS